MIKNVIQWVLNVFSRAVAQALANAGPPRAFPDAGVIFRSDDPAADGAVIQGLCDAARMGTLTEVPGKLGLWWISEVAQVGPAIEVRGVPNEEWAG